MDLSWGLSPKFSKLSSIPECQIGNIDQHGLGSSINCLGRRIASYTTRDAKEIAKLLAMVVVDGKKSI